MYLLFLVTVEDVNEERPIFDQPSYYRILLDNSTADTLVVDINARDESKAYDEGIFYNISGMLEKKSYRCLLLRYLHTAKLSCMTEEWS